MSRTLEIDIDDTMRERIRSLQKHHNLTEAGAAEKAKISKAKYKNYVRLTKGAKTMSSQTLKQIADALECTTDYLLNKSDDPALDRDGNNIIKPINYSLRDEIINDLSQYFIENFPFAKSLHFIFCELDSANRQNMVRCIDTLAECMRNSIYYNIDKYSDVIDLLRLDDPDFKRIIEKLARANEYRSDGLQIYALKEYLSIIQKTVNEDLRFIVYAERSSKNAISIAEEFPEIIPPALSDMSETLSRIATKRFIIKGKDSKKINNYITYLNEHHP